MGTRTHWRLYVNHVKVSSTCNRRQGKPRGVNMYSRVNLQLRDWNEHGHSARTTTPALSSLPSSINTLSFLLGSFLSFFQLHLLHSFSNCPRLVRAFTHLHMDIYMDIYGSDSALFPPGEWASNLLCSTEGPCSLSPPSLSFKNSKK